MDLFRSRVSRLVSRPGPAGVPAGVPPWPWWCPGWWPWRDTWCPAVAMVVSRLMSRLVFWPLPPVVARLFLGCCPGRGSAGVPAAVPAGVLAVAPGGVPVVSRLVSAASPTVRLGSVHQYVRG